MAETNLKRVIQGTLVFEVKAANLSEKEAADVIQILERRLDRIVKDFAKMGMIYSKQSVAGITVKGKPGFA